MIAEIKDGIIREELGVKTGKTRSGKDWEKRDYLVIVNPSTPYEHDVKVSLQSFDGHVMNPPKKDDRVDLTIKLVAHQFNGKWYNEVNATSYTNITRPTPL